MSEMRIVARPDVPFDRLADDLCAAIKSCDHVALDVSDLPSPDLWTVQLIQAARRQAAARGIVFGLTSAAPAPLSDVLRRGGFLTEPTAADLSFWFNGVAIQ